MIFTLTSNKYCASQYLYALHKIVEVNVIYIHLNNSEQQNIHDDNNDEKNDFMDNNSV